MVFVCPDCGASISPPQPHSCPNCDFSYNTDKYGVTHQKEITYEYEHTEKSTEKLAEEVYEMGNEFFEYEEIRRLENYYKEFSYDYCLDLGRFDWLGIQDFTGKTVVDIGCGFGGASIYAAKHGADRVYSIDGNLGRLRFLGAWAEKENIGNLYPIHADALELTFEKEAIDVCLMVGSLEWIGAISKKNPHPKKAQLSLLNNINKWLSPDGDLLVAIENRFALQHFFGYTPHVVEPPFSTILPRTLANFVSKTIGNRPYNVYTYSYRGYKKILFMSGFPEQKFYIPLPSYQHPRVVFPLKEGILTDALSKWSLDFPKNVAKYILTLFDQIGKGHWFVPAYIIRASK